MGRCTRNNGRGKRLVMSYHQFAYIYDQLMDHAPYDKWVQFTTEIIKRKNASIKSIVDLGCGTGEITSRLAKLGYHVTGVDYSIEMLACATEKVINHKLPVNWIQQDIRKLSGFHQIDLFISYCDVMNYITELNEVETVFNHVYNSLSPNGLFIFDIHSIHYAEERLMNQTFTEVTDDLAYIWDCEQGDRQGEMFHYLTFFRKENDHYIRFDETHHQHTYDIKVYEQLLKKCGFSKIQFYRDFSLEKAFLSEKSERIFIVGEK